MNGMDQSSSAEPETEAGKPTLQQKQPGTVTQQPPPAGMVSRQSPQREAYWFAQGGISPPVPDPGVDPEFGQDLNGDAENVASSVLRDREERLRVLRERQLAERQRRIEELKTSAQVAQRHREQQEEERRRRIEELRSRDAERRMAVEDRKRQLWEAEQERREVLMRRSQEREARIEAAQLRLRGQSSAGVAFAFGSSTPRALELDSGSAYLGGGKRAVGSVILIPAVPSRERVLAGPLTPTGEPAEGFNRSKRALSTYHLDRRSSSSEAASFRHSYHEGFDSAVPWWSALPPVDGDAAALSYAERNYMGTLTGSGVFVGEDVMSQSFTSASLTAALSGRRYRKRTDLMPTIPGMTSGSATPRTSRQGTKTPGSPVTSRSPSRPNSSMSQQSLSSHNSNVNTNTIKRRPPATNRKPRPISVAGSTLDRPITAAERMSRSIEKRERASPRARSAGGKESSEEPQPRSEKTTKPPTAPKPQIPNKASEGKPAVPPKPANLTQKRTVVNKTNDNSKPKEEKKPEDKPKPPPKPATRKPAPKKPAAAGSVEEQLEATVEERGNAVQEAITPETAADSNAAEKEIIPVSETPPPPPPESAVTAPVTVEKEVVAVPEESAEPQEEAPSVVQKPRITTEEEAKAAMAERRRLAREQAEREAELERLRQEELQRQEEERIRQEEEAQRLWEEEQDRARKMEEERLRQAIEERQRVEEEERLRMEEEARQKAEREEAERQAREEAERVRKETEEKLRREEEERAERRKRVEAIMSRTRGKTAGTSPVTTPTKGSELAANILAQKNSSAASILSSLNRPKSDTNNAEDAGSNNVNNNINNNVVAADEDSLTKVPSNEDICIIPQPDLIGDVLSEGCQGLDLLGNASNLPRKDSADLSLSDDASLPWSPAPPVYTNGFMHHGVIIDGGQVPSVNSSTKVSPASDDHIMSDIEIMGAGPAGDASNLLVDLGFEPPLLNADPKITPTDTRFLLNEDSVNSNLLVRVEDGRPMAATVTDLL